MILPVDITTLFEYLQKTFHSPHSRPEIKKLPQEEGYMPQKTALKCKNTIKREYLIKNN